jgi:hypothetical protein
VGGQFGNKQTAGFTIKISMGSANKNYIKTLLIIKTIDAIKLHTANYKQWKLELNAAMRTQRYETPKYDAT